MKISVLGDSISSYTGMSNNVINRSEQNDNYYPSGNVDNPSETWWAQVIGAKGGTTLVNGAIGGTCVGWYYNPDGSLEKNDYYHLGSKWCMNNADRINSLGGVEGSVNCPDAILFFGGTNDCCRSNDVFDSNKFFMNYANAVRMMIDRYGVNTKIICITPYKCYLTEANGNYKSVVDLIWLTTIQDFAKDSTIFVDLSKLDMTGKLDANFHPNAKGMDAIADEVLKCWK